MSKKSNLIELRDLAIRHNTAERDFFRVKNEHEAQMRDIQKEFAPRVEAYNQVVRNTAWKFGYEMYREACEALLIPSDAIFSGISEREHNGEPLITVHFEKPAKDSRTGLPNGKTERLSMPMDLLINDPIAVAQHTRKFIRGLQGKQAVQAEQEATKAFEAAQKTLQAAQEKLTEAQKRTAAAEQRVLNRAHKNAAQRA